MVYAKFGGQTECIMGNWKIENNRTVKVLPRERNTEMHQPRPQDFFP